MNSKNPRHVFVTNIVTFRDNGYEYTVTTYTEGNPQVERVLLPITEAIAVIRYNRL